MTVTPEPEWLAEADIDMLLVLDAATNGPIVNDLLRRANFAGPVTRVLRQGFRTFDSRSTDVHIETADGWLLVENKIRAPFQEGQPQSYANEVRRIRNLPEHRRAAAVLLAPQIYLSGLALEEAECFDLRVSYEHMAAISVAEGAQKVVSDLLLQAVSQGRGIHYSETLALWGADYRRVLKDIQVAISEPLVLHRNVLTGTQGGWAHFQLPELGDDWLAHKILEGAVDVHLHMLKHPDAPNPPQGAELLQTGKSWRYRVPVEPMRFDVPPSDQRGAMEQMLRAALSQREWVRTVSPATSVGASNGPR